MGRPRQGFCTGLRAKKCTGALGFERFRLEPGGRHGEGVLLPRLNRAPRAEKNRFKSRTRRVGAPPGGVSQPPQSSHLLFRSCSKIRIWLPSGNPSKVGFSGKPGGAGEYDRSPRKAPASLEHPPDGRNVEFVLDGKDPGRKRRRVVGRLDGHGSLGDDRTRVRA
jgi:hypothetical protein